MERYKVYGLSPHRSRPHGTGSEPGVLCLPAAFRLRCGLRCVELQVSVGSRGGGGESGVGVTKLGIFWFRNLASTSGPFQLHVT